MESSERLSKALEKLKNRYPMLLFHANQTCQVGKPFLHAWKPMDAKSKTQGMSLLPTFHSIVEESEVLTDMLSIKLYSYHGKTLATNHVSLESLEDVKIPVLEDLATDSLHICQVCSISHISCFPLKLCTFSISLKLPHSGARFLSCYFLRI